MNDAELYDVVAPAIGPLPPSPHPFYAEISNAGVFITYESEDRARYNLSWWLRVHGMPFGEITKTEHGWTTQGTMQPCEKASVIVVLLRLEHGGSLHTCPTCGQARSAPYRRRVRGKIVEGCVDAAHTGWVMGDDKTWHNRPQGVQIREAEARRLQERRADHRARWGASV